MTHTPADLDALENLAREAWPSPWEYRDDENGMYVCSISPDAPKHAAGNPVDLMADGGEPTWKFIAAANPAVVLALIAELRTARAALAITDEIVERTARAICTADGESPDATWQWADNEGTRISFWKKYVPHATAALAPAPTEGKT